MGETKEPFTLQLLMREHHHRYTKVEREDTEKRWQERSRRIDSQRHWDIVQRPSPPSVWSATEISVNDLIWRDIWRPSIASAWMGPEQPKTTFNGHGATTSGAVEMKVVEAEPHQHRDDHKLHSMNTRTRNQRKGLMPPPILNRLTPRCLPRNADAATIDVHGGKVNA